MKKISLCILLFLGVLFSRADEGMWIPLLLQQMNEADMQARGLKLSAEDLYSINHSSLKDAIVHFNGGCTGEIISPEGLLITNHHCGYSEIQSHSSVEKDYLTRGFWAKTKEEELPGSDLFVSIIVEIRNVTDSVLKGTFQGMSEKERKKIIEENSGKINKEATKDTHYEAYIRPFYYGNEFYQFIVETFDDIRLVGAPPSSIGKFGGDTDNWMWPRHTGDFSIFRIYAGKDNKPAKFSQDNVPYKPKHYLPVSLKGVKEGDFTMVYGFPGRTQEYLVSDAVDYVMNKSNPVKIKMRETALTLMNSDMKASDEVRIKYAAKNARIANYWKKWIGESRGLKKLNAVEKKKILEKEFISLVEKNKANEYDTLFSKFQKLYAGLEKYGIPYDYYYETVYVGTEIVRFASQFKKITRECEKGQISDGRLDTLLKELKEGAKWHFKDYNAATDKKIFAALFQMYYDGTDKVSHPPVFRTIEEKFPGAVSSRGKSADFGKYTDYLFARSVFADEKKLNEMLDAFKVSHYKKIRKDPAYLLMDDMSEHFAKNIKQPYDSIVAELDKHYRLYVKGMMGLMPAAKKYYPDANSTLRITYGKVEGYQPADGVTYNYYTTIDGIIEKADTTVDDFIIPANLPELYRKKDYGGYDKNGNLVVCFTASNHTTGGNSGSPVIDAEGNLIGVNFDRTWESTMSDIMYDPDRCRNIALDMSYVLFVIDKVCGAGDLIKEMKVIR